MKIKIAANTGEAVTEETTVAEETTTPPTEETTTPLTQGQIEDMDTDFFPVKSKRKYCKKNLVPFSDTSSEENVGERKKREKKTR